jgi:hypothetical protein
MGWVTPDELERSSATFLPREWNEHFAGLAPVERHAFSAELCRKVVASVGVRGDEVERAIAALADGEVSDDQLCSIRLLVEQFEREYDTLVGDDESKLSCRDPEIAAADRRMAAAWTLRCALEGDLSGVAYYAWAVLDDLPEIRRLAGMPRANQEPA